MGHQPGNTGAYLDSFSTRIILENKASYDVYSCRIIGLSAPGKQQAASHFGKKFIWYRQSSCEFLTKYGTV